MLKRFDVKAKVVVTVVAETAAGERDRTERIKSPQTGEI